MWFYSLLNCNISYTLKFVLEHEGLIFFFSSLFQIKYFHAFIHSIHTIYIYTSETYVKIINKMNLIQQINFHFKYTCILNRLSFSIEKSKLIHKKNVTMEKNIKNIYIHIFSIMKNLLVFFFFENKYYFKLLRNNKKRASFPELFMVHCIAGNNVQWEYLLIHNEIQQQQH